MSTCQKFVLKGIPSKVKNWPRNKQDMYISAPPPPPQKKKRGTKCIFFLFLIMLIGLSPDNSWAKYPGVKNTYYFPSASEFDQGKKYYFKKKNLIIFLAVLESLFLVIKQTPVIIKIPTSTNSKKKETKAAAYNYTVNYSKFTNKHLLHKIIPDIGVQASFQQSCLRIWKAVEPNNWYNICGRRSTIISS